MTRQSVALLLGCGLLLWGAGCNDTLPPLPDSGGNEDGGQLDGSTHDVGVPSDGQPLPDVTVRPDLLDGCVDNAGCDPTEYCHFANGCAGPGICRPRPMDCPMLYAPVCGCDGQTYGNACAAEAEGVNVRHVGDCNAPTQCVGNGGCDSDQFCNLDYHCDTTRYTGVCDVRPDGCPLDLYFPVCGCDNNDYNSPCEAHIVGVSIFHDGQCDAVDPNKCAALEGEYATLLAEAKQCAVSPGGPEFTCDTRVLDALACGCTTYVAQRSPDAITGLEGLRDSWVAAGCDQLPVQCTLCVEPNGAYCDSSTPNASFRCVDQ